MEELRQSLTKRDMATGTIRLFDRKVNDNVQDRPLELFKIYVYTIQIGLARWVHVYEYNQVSFY